jgi:hypothetical protein
MPTDNDDAGEKPEQELRARGISKSEFAAWRHHPVTKVYRKFMLDFRADLIATASELWLDRPLDQANDHEMRYRAKTLKEMAELPFEAIVNFYEQQAELAAQTNKLTPTEEDDDDEAATD